MSINKQDAEEFTQSLGQIVGGSWRQIALAKRMGVPQALGLSTETWVRERLGGYVRLAVDERREAVRELAEEGMSQRGIGEVLGVDHRTVGNDLIDGENSPADAVKPRAIDHGNGENSPLDAVALLAADEKVMAEASARGGPWVMHNSGNEQWYTPPEILEPARAVLGGFDLDPASSPKANLTVRATRFFTAEDDGLAQEWPIGRIWLNPPYTIGVVDRFAARLVAEIRRGSTAIALTNNGTETRWCQALVDVCAALCLPQGRVRYLDETGSGGSSGLQGQCLFYFGPDPQAFRDAFAGVGAVLPGPQAW